MGRNMGAIPGNPEKYPKYDFREKKRRQSI